MLVPFQDLMDRDLFVVYNDAPTNHYLYMKSGNLALRYSFRDNSISAGVLQLHPDSTQSRAISPSQVVLKITTSLVTSK